FRQMGERWRIELLGGLRAVWREQVVERFPTQKAAVLLAFLAYDSRRAHPRDTLIEMLWPGVDPESGRHSLSQALFSLRRLLKLPGADPLVGADNFSVRLAPGAVTTDVAEFEAALDAAAAAETATERARALQAAVELHRGALLPGYYEDWIVSEQERLGLR